MGKQTSFLALHAGVNSEITIDFKIDKTRGKNRSKVWKKCESDVNALNVRNRVCISATTLF